MGAVSGTGSAGGRGGGREGVEISKNKRKTWSEDPAATILQNEKTVAPAGDEVAKRADR